MPFGLSPDILDAGGWVFAAIVLAIVIAALIRGDLVPGAIHKRESARADTATAQLERQGETAEKLADQVEDLAGNVKQLVEILGRVLRVPTGPAT